MAQEQSIEAARARIQRLVDEIAALSKKELRTEEFLQQFIVRAVQASDARGGAVWLVGQRSAEGKHEFQLAAAVDFESSLFQSDEQQRANLLKTLAEVVQTRKPLIFPPSTRPGDGTPAQGAWPAQAAPLQSAEANKTVYAFLQVPLNLKEQILGVLQVWLQPYVTPQNYNEFVVFLTSLAAYVEQHFQSRRLGTLVLETQRLQHLLKFSGDLAGSLDPIEVARLAASYGRDLIGCERCSVLTRWGDQWRVLAISGQEIVERKSAMVKGMAAFVSAHATNEMVVLSKKELLARAEAASIATTAPPDETAAVNGEISKRALALRRTDEIDLAYFQLSHVVSAAIAPLLDRDKQLVGAYFAESTAEDFFESNRATKDLPAPTRVAEWLATHTSRSLQAAQDYKSLPFLAITSRLRDTRARLMGPKRNRLLFRSALLAALLFGIALFPKMERIDGDCTLLPVHRGTIVPEVPGRVDRVMVREGDRVQQGQPIAQLDTSRIETEIEANRQEMRSRTAESERYRGLGDEASAQVAQLQASVAEQNDRKLARDLAAATLRSPISGVILTKDVELHAGQVIQSGMVFAEVAAFDAWELQIDIDEKRIGRVEQAMHARAGKEPLPVHFILYSQSAYKLQGALARREQISASAYPREKQNVFIITTPVQLPAEIQNAMRPGLTGRAKIDVGRKPLVWIMARNVWHWLELRLIV
jgi:biotin carboxyl carrier protein